MLVIYAVLLALQSIAALLNVHIFLENAGSMKPIHQDFIQKIFGIRECCCHHIAGAAFGHVERNRKFFTRYEQIGEFCKRPTPWFRGGDLLQITHVECNHRLLSINLGFVPNALIMKEVFDWLHISITPRPFFIMSPALVGQKHSIGFHRLLSLLIVSQIYLGKGLCLMDLWLTLCCDVQKLSLQADVPSLAAMDRFAETNAELLRAENAFLIGDKDIHPFRVAHYKEMLKDAELDGWLGDIEEHVNDMCIA